MKISISISISIFFHDFTFSLRVPFVLRWVSSDSIYIGLVFLPIHPLPGTLMRWLGKNHSFETHLPLTPPSPKSRCRPRRGGKGC